VSLREAFRNIRDALEEVGVPYMITGSVASSVHGVPRATQDIDVVIEPTREQLVALMHRFEEPAYDADVEEALDAFRRRSMFSIIDRRGIWKIDFILRKSRPFSKKEFDRRLQRQLRDAAGIIEIQGEKLNNDYGERWAAALDVEDQLHAARAKAG
jgi:hypothetical protein